MGKPPTFRRAPDRIRFDGHVEVGVAMARGNLPPLPLLQRRNAGRSLALVENHMRFADAPRMKASTLKRFFRLEALTSTWPCTAWIAWPASGNLDHWKFVRERWRIDAGGDGAARSR